MVKFIDRCFLYNTVFRYHKEIFAGKLMVIRNRNDCIYLFSRVKLQQIDNCCTSCSSACFRNLISLHTINTSEICKEHNIVMRMHHQKIFDIIIFDRLHSLDSLTTSVLCTEIINCHTLDIAKGCHGNDCIFSRYHIFHTDIEFIKSYFGSSVVTVFISNRFDFCLDNT